MRMIIMRPVLIAAFAMNWGIGYAASPAIGRIVAKGAFRADNVTVTGNATLLEGSTIETAQAVTSLELLSGAKFRLQPDSKGRIFGDHAVLERGAGSLEKSTGFHVEARGLSIRPETADATGSVALLANQRIQVSALTGSFRVLNAQGMVVARLRPGTALAFQPQGPQGLTRVQGVLQVKSGHYLITDETTNVTVEVIGEGLDKEVGRRVDLTGTADPSATPVSGASQIIRVTSARRLPGGAAPAGSGGFPPPGSSGVGISAGTVAIIGGVAAGAAVGGLAAAGVFEGQEAAISR
jgi:hypothetical protein